MRWLPKASLEKSFKLLKSRGVDYVAWHLFGDGDALLSRGGTPGGYAPDIASIGADFRAALDIAERTITEVPGITGLIDRLESQGLVSRCRDTNDRRYRCPSQRDGRDSDGTRRFVEVRTS